jgi:hypothetical protein
MRPDVEQPQLEHRKKPHGPRADNYGICLVRLYHDCLVIEYGKKLNQIPSLFLPLPLAGEGWGEGALKACLYK